MPQRNIGAGLLTSERALLDLWDLIDQIRLAQSEQHAAIAATKALEAARTSTNPNDPLIQAVKDPDYRDLH